MPQPSHASNVTVVNPTGKAEFTNGLIWITLSIPLQSVASGSGSVILLSQASTSTANVSVSVQARTGPSVSLAMTILAIAVEVAPQPSSTVHVTGIVAPQALSRVEASKSLVIVRSVRSVQLSSATTLSSHPATSREMSCPQVTIRSVGAVSVGALLSVTV